MSELSVPLRPTCLMEGHPCMSSPSSQFCLFWFPSLSPIPFPFSPLSYCVMCFHPHWDRAGFRADARALSLRLGPRCQLRAFLSNLSLSLSLSPLSPSSRGQRRPYKAAFPHIHFWQFRCCHSKQSSGERPGLRWRSRQGLCFLVKARLARQKPACLFVEIQSRVAVLQSQFLIKKWVLTDKISTTSLVTGSSTLLIVSPHLDIGLMMTTDDTAAQNNLFK